PRINFAAALIAIGVIKRTHQGDAVDNQLARLKKLKGCWVSFVEGGRTSVGLLEKVPEDTRGHCSILHYKKKLPDFDSMSEEQRKRYIPPKSGGLWSLVSADNWPSIKPTGRDFDCQKGARAAEVAKANRQSSRIQAFNQYFGTDLGDEILSS